LYTADRKMAVPQDASQSMGDAQYALRPDVDAALEAPRVIAGSHDPLLE
jgi:hypothetical protein